MAGALDGVKVLEVCSFITGPYAGDETAYFQDPQVSHLDRIIELQHPQIGALRLVRNGVTLGKTPTEVAALPPGLGEHTDQILSSLGSPIPGGRKWRPLFWRQR